MRLIERNPCDPIAEEVLSFAALDRRRRNVQSRGMHALVLAIDRSETQDMVRISHRRCVMIDRSLADVIDHPSATHGASNRSRVVKYVEATTSDSFRSEE